MEEQAGWLDEKEDAGGSLYLQGLTWAGCVSYSRSLLRNC